MRICVQRVKAVNESPLWSLMVDECTDSATMEQLGVYVRYIDIEKYKLSEEFLEMKHVTGHPDANNIFSSLMEVIDPDQSDSKLPLHQLAGFASDGASVLISPQQGVLGKLRSTVNLKLFSSNCPLHKLVLASKEGQKELPDDIEKTLSDTLYFFRDSSVRRDEFKKLKEIIDPDSPHVAIVQYHKVRWFSMSDCVSRLVQLLPLLVQYFEEQAEDTRNRPAEVQRSAQPTISTMISTIHVLPELSFRSLNNEGLMSRMSSDLFLHNRILMLVWQ